RTGPDACVRACCCWPCWPAPAAPPHRSSTPPTTWRAWTPMATAGSRRRSTWPGWATPSSAWTVMAMGCSRRTSSPAARGVRSASRSIAAAWPSASCARTPTATATSTRASWRPRRADDHASGRAPRRIHQWLPVLQQPQHDGLLADVVGADEGFDQPGPAVQEAGLQHVAAEETPRRRQQQLAQGGALAAREVVLGHHPGIALLLVQQLHERAVREVEQVARQQRDLAVHRHRLVDLAAAPPAAAAAVEQAQHPVRVRRAVAQEAAVVLGHAREPVAGGADEAGVTLGLDRRAQARVHAFVRVQAQDPVV